MEGAVIFLVKFYWPIEILAILQPEQAEAH